MRSCVLKLCLFLFLTVQGTYGAEMTIKAEKDASVTLRCPYNNNIQMCSCDTSSEECSINCENVKTLTHSSQNSNGQRFFELSGLQHSDSGLYSCHSSYAVLSEKYRLKVFEDQDPTVVIGTLGQSVVLSCGTGMNTMGASDKHWCRLQNKRSCHQDTNMRPGDEISNNFKVLDSETSFSLEKRELTLNDSGLYQCNVTSQNQTKSFDVELQVKNATSFLEIIPRRVNPRPDEKFEIACQYSQDLKEFHKYYLCDGSGCPDAVKTVDDRFKSALMLTMDDAACSKIRSLQCVAEVMTDTKKSGFFYTSFKNPLQEHTLYLQYTSSREYLRFEVKTYNLLKLRCIKDSEYYRYYGRWNYYHYEEPKWCRLSRGKCTPGESSSTNLLEICVTPSYDRAQYSCQAGGLSLIVEIVVKAPPPPPPPPPLRSPPNRKNVNPPNNAPSPNSYNKLLVITLTVVPIVFLVAFIILFAAYRHKGQRSNHRRRVALFRRTPLAAVDAHANQYAKSLAQYYSNHRSQLPQLEKVEEGENGEHSSGSDDEFEDISVLQKKGTCSDYITVKPKETSLPQSDDFNGSPGGSEESDQCGPSKNADNASKQQKAVTQSRSKDVHDDKVDDEDVTYTHVVIQPKPRRQ